MAGLHSAATRSTLLPLPVLLGGARLLQLCTPRPRQPPLNLQDLAAGRQQLGARTALGLGWCGRCSSGS